MFNHNYPRAFIGLNFDVSQPIGSFARTDFEGKEPGFALIGLGGNIQAGFYFTKRLGMHIRLGGGSNMLDVEAYKNYYADKSDPNEVLYVNYDQSRNEQNYESWSHQYAALGPLYSFKLAKWLTVDTRLQFGAMNVTKPSLRIYAVDTSSTSATGGVIPKYSIDSERRGGKTFPTYGGGLSFRISPGRRIAFVLSADYMHAGGTINFQESIYIPDFTQPYTGNTYLDIDRVYNIDQIKLSVGIAYQFKRKNR